MALIDEKKLIEELHILRDVMDFEDGQGFQKGFVAGVDKAIETVVQADRIINEQSQKSIPKKPKKLKKLKLYMCPTCGNAGLTRYARNGRNENYYCYNCGQKLDWSEANDR